MENKPPNTVKDLTNAQLLEWNKKLEHYNDGVDVQGDFWLIAEKQIKSEMKTKNIL